MGGQPASLAYCGVEPYWLGDFLRGRGRFHGGGNLADARAFDASNSESTLERGGDGLVALRFVHVVRRGIFSKPTNCSLRWAFGDGYCPRALPIGIRLGRDRRADD